MKISYYVNKLKSGGFVAYCPTMEPVKVFGKTSDEASKKLVHVAKLYIKTHPEFNKNVKTSELDI